MRLVLNIPVERWGRLAAPIVRSRWKWPLAVAAVGVLVVFGIGLVSLSKSVLKLRVGGVAKTATGAPSNGASQQTGSSDDQVTHISEATFGYLTPKLDPDWDYDAGSLVYDATKGVVRYSLKFHNNNVGVVITQQTMPVNLMPRTSGAFQTFVNDNKVARSMDTDAGTVYFLPAMKNGVLGGGADTVIYATDSVLMFGKADQMVGYDPWMKLMGDMQIAAPK